MGKIIVSAYLFISSVNYESEDGLGRTETSLSDRTGRPDRSPATNTMTPLTSFSQQLESKRFELIATYVDKKEKCIKRLTEHIMLSTLGQLVVS